MAPREGSAPVVDLRQHQHPRPRTRLRPVPPPDGAGGDGHPTPPPSREDCAGQPGAADVGRRLRFRHRSSRSPGCTPEAGRRAGAARSRHHHHRRPVRPGPTALAVHHRRGTARRHAPHSSRRCITRSPTARVASSCRSSSSTSNATQSPPPMPDPDTIDSTDVTCRRRCSRGRAGPARRNAPAPDRRRPPDAPVARRSEPDPRRRGGRGRHAPRHRRPARRHRRSAQPVVDRAVTRPASRSRLRAVQTDQGCVEGARRHAQHGVPHHCHRRGQPLPRRTRSAGRRRSAPRWRSARAPTIPAPTRSRSSGCSCRRARCRSTNGSARSTPATDEAVESSRSASLDALAAFAVDPADLGGHPPRPPAGAHRRLRDLERQGVTDPDVRGRREAARATTPWGR